MAINFPNNPSVNDTFTSGGTTFTWNGSSWVSAISTNIVDDTTPQLGGDLDGTTKNIHNVGVITATNISATNVSASGSITAANFYGDGTNLTGIDASSITSGGTVKVQAVSTGATVTGNLDVSGDLNVSGNATFQNDVSLGDSDEIRLGDGGDLQLWHNGGQSYISNITGPLNIRTTSGDNINLLSDDDVGIRVKGRSETAANFIADGAVELYYDNSKKFETTNTGARVTGDLIVDGVLSYEDVTNLDSIGIATARTGLDVTSGGIDVTGLSTFRDYLRVNADNSDSRLYVGSGPSSNQAELRHINGYSYLYHYGEHTFHIALAGGSTNKIQFDTISEKMCEMYRNGSVNLYYDGSEKFATTGYGATVTGNLDVSGVIRQELHTPAMPVGLNDDIGEHWEDINQTHNWTLDTIKSISYCGDGIVLAGGGAFYGDVLRSTDYGKTFVRIENDNLGDEQVDISAVVYCGNGIALAGSRYSNANSGDIFRSTDYGLTWTKVEMGSTLEEIVSLEYCGNGIVLAGSGWSTDDGDVYRSTDYGQTWTKVEMGSTLERIHALCYIGNGIVLAGSGSNTDDGDVYRSTDFGQNWTKIEMGAVLEDILSFAYCGNGTVLAGAGDSTGDGDVYRSTDWSNLDQD